MANHEPERVRRVKRLIACAASLMLLVGCAPVPYEARFLFIDVGKGDAALVMAGDENYLIDAGPKDRWDQVSAALTQYGVTKLDGVFLTHGDKDHAGGLKPLAKSGIKVDAWYASDLYNLDKDEDVHPLEEAAQIRGQHPVYLSAGDNVGPFSVLGPLERHKDDDDNSLILMLQSGGGRALFTGDMKFDGEAELLKGGRSLDCDLIKIAHHGNSDSTSDLLIDATTPSIAVVSTDSVQRPELPDARIVATLQARGIPLYSTSGSGGGILVTLTGAKVNANTVTISG
jgi:competence protein ComEC